MGAQKIQKTSSCKKWSICEWDKNVEQVHSRSTTFVIINNNKNLSVEQRCSVLCALCESHFIQMVAFLDIYYVATFDDGWFFDQGIEVKCIRLWSMKIYYILPKRLYNVCVSTCPRGGIIYFVSFNLKALSALQQS